MQCIARLKKSVLALLIFVALECSASEFTFELPDRDTQCFYEEILNGTRCTLEFQVRSRKGCMSIF